MAPGVLRGKDWDQNRCNFDGYGWKQIFYLLMAESEPVLNLASKLFIEKKFSEFVTTKPSVVPIMSLALKVMSLKPCFLIWTWTSLNLESSKLKISMWQNITETLIYFLYNEDIQDKTLVNLNLLYAADKYNVPRLVEICAAYLKLSLSVVNVLDILVAVHHGLAGSFQGCLKLCLQKKDSWPTQELGKK